jgi:high-affinity Fe2+/Pb2+ permease
VFSSFITLLREGFEVTLLVAIVLAYLVKIERREDIRQVWYGVGAALLRGYGDVGCRRVPDVHDPLDAAGVA